MSYTSVSVKHLIVAVLFVVVAGVVQNTALVTVAGIRPNILLALLVVLSFFIVNVLHYLTLVFLSGALLHSYALGIRELIVFMLVAVLFGVVSDKFPGKPIFNALIITFIATACFYLFIDLLFVLESAGAVVLEMVYNTLIAGLIFLLVSRIFTHETRLGPAI